MPKKKKDARGGPRPGSGRPKHAPGTKRITLSVVVAPQTETAMRKKAAGKPLGTLLDATFAKGE